MLFRSMDGIMHHVSPEMFHVFRCKNLRDVDLSSNNIVSLNGFDGTALTQLNTLKIANNKIESFNSLDALPSLFHLYIQGNQISSTRELQTLAQKLPSLKSLFLRNLDGSDPNPSNILSALTKL